MQDRLEHIIATWMRTPSGLPFVQGLSMSPNVFQPFASVEEVLHSSGSGHLRIAEAKRTVTRSGEDATEDERVAKLWEVVRMT